MDQNFSLMAQSRANYYTAGSPVQFVRVELLKGDTPGEVAVCLPVKNVRAAVRPGRRFQMYGCRRSVTVRG